VSREPTGILRSEPLLRWKDRRSLGLARNVLSEDSVLDGSDRENNTFTHYKHAAAEYIYEKEGDLRAILRLDNPMSNRVEPFDCSLHMLTFRLQACTSRHRDTFRFNIPVRKAETINITISIL
jgi:hypothetical protein